MNQAAAYKLIDQTLGSWHSKTFEEIASLVGQTITDRVRGDDHQMYLVETRFSWCPEKTQAIYIDVMVAADGTGPLRRIDRRLTMNQQDA